MTHKHIIDALWIGTTAGFTLRRLQSAYGKAALDNLLGRWNVKVRVQRAMHWPIAWRLAVRLGKSQTHNETGLCLACHAEGRIAEDRHLPKDSAAYVIVCGKCNLPKNRWGKRCKGAPVFVRVPVVQARHISKPAFW